MIESWHFSVNCKYHLISYCISKKYSNFRIYICCSFEVVHHLIIHFFSFCEDNRFCTIFFVTYFFDCAKLNFYIISRFMHLKNHNIIDVSFEQVIYRHHSFSWCPHISHCFKPPFWSKNSTYGKILSKNKIERKVTTFLCPVFLVYQTRAKRSAGIMMCPLIRSSIHSMPINFKEKVSCHVEICCRHFF